MAESSFESFSPFFFRLPQSLRHLLLRIQNLRKTSSHLKVIAKEDFLLAWALEYEVSALRNDGIMRLCHAT